VEETGRARKGLIVKIYINTDLEGVGGVVYAEQIQEGTVAYREACHFLTQEVNSAVEGALSAGAAEILVCDAHGSERGPNLILQELHAKAEYIVGRRPSMMPGLDSSFHALLLLGFHPRIGTLEGVFDHTLSYPLVHDFRANGEPLGEIGIFAALAGEVGVPTAFVSGDAAACNEATALLGQIQVAVVKKGLGRHCAQILQPERSRALIRHACEMALGGNGLPQPFKVSTPVELTLEFQTVEQADKIALTEGRRRTDSRTILFPGRTFTEAFDKVWRVL
jgi:D-amino peptidase